MSLPPEHISVKRRRQEEPVETLYLENDGARSKRRFTEYYFQRLRVDEPPTTPEITSPGNTGKNSNEKISESVYNSAGVPLVQSTSPGAEARHASQRKAAREQRLEELHVQNAPLTTSERVNNLALGESQSCEVQKPTISLAAPTRRFHLTRSGLGPLAPTYSAGIRKRNIATKRMLATFIENPLSSSVPAISPTSTNLNVVDRMLNDSAIPRGSESISKNLLDFNSSESAPLQSIKTASSTGIQTFIKPPSVNQRLGHSIEDHPSTWDHDSDQLADELAAFALELSGESNTRDNEDEKFRSNRRAEPSIPNPDVVMDDDFVYETYIRIRRDQALEDVPDKATSVGIIVIEEKDEELWQAFAEYDEESEWDEEDADSNAEDNPANDYPEEEISSDDEYGYQAYRYRKGASDDEEYDVDNNEWN